MPTKIIGTAPYQVPRNADLGTLAVQDADNINIQGGVVALGASTTQGYFQNTDVSEVKPTLLLDFANAKVLDGRVSLSRSTTATFYDGKTFAKAEENLLYYTNDLTNSFWNKTNIAVGGNAGIAPDGTSTAASIAISSTSGYHYFYVGTSQIALSIPGGVATYSIYVKANGCTKVGFREGATTGNVVTYDLSAGTVLYATNPSNNSGTISNAGNGWYRITATFSNITSQRYEFWMLSNSYTTGDLLINWAGDNASGVYIWGPQLELRGIAGAFVPTTGTQPVTTYLPALQTASANTARFDHDPVTGESKGLLIEQSKTNLISYSSDLGGWGKNQSTAFLNCCIAPDGTLSADKIVANAGVVGTGNDDLGSAYTTVSGVSANTTYIFSFYAKAAELNAIKIREIVQTGATIRVNIADDTYVESYSPSLSVVSISNVGNGWKRIVTQYTTSAGQTTWGISLKSGLDVGDGYSGVYLWGMQLELGGSAVSSYIPTSGSQVTKSADNASISGMNFSSWYNPQEGTLYAEAATIMATAGDKRIAEITHAAADLRQYDLRTNGSSISSIQLGQGAANDVTISGVVSSGTYHKVAVSNGDGVANIAANGMLGATKTLNRMFEADTMYIGTYAASAYYINGWVKKLAFYPKRLSNAELQEITL